MVKFTTSVVAAALLSVPAIATSYEQYERSVAESDLYGRDLFSNDDILAVREEDLDEFFGRELVDDLEGRGLNFGALLNLAKGLRRAKSLKSLTGGSGGSSSNSNNDGNNGNNVGHHHRHWFRRGLDAELDLRDFEEDLEAREPVNLEALAKGIHALHKAHKAAHTASQFVPQGGSDDNENNQRRDLYDEEMFERDFDVRDFEEGLEAREPVNLEALAKGMHALHKAHKAAHTASKFVPQGGNDDNENNQRRDLYDEEMFERDFDEFLTREYYDNLD